MPHRTVFVLIALAATGAGAAMQMSKAFPSTSSDLTREAAEMAAWMKLSPGSTVCEVGARLLAVRLCVV